MGIVPSMILSSMILSLLCPCHPCHPWLSAEVKKTESWQDRIIFRMILSVFLLGVNCDQAFMLRPRYTL
jgi:hypothetical protein